MTSNLNKSSRFSVALGGFLILMGILFAVVFAGAISETAITDVLMKEQSEMLLMVMMVVGFLDVIGGLLLRRE